MNKPEATHMVAPQGKKVRLVTLPDGKAPEEKKEEPKEARPDVKVKLTRDHQIEGQNFAKGTVLEVDAETADSLCKKFDVPTQFYGTRDTSDVDESVKKSAIAVRV